MAPPAVGEKDGKTTEQSRDRDIFGENVEVPLLVPNFWGGG